MDHTVPHPELYNVPFLTESFNGMPYRRLGRSGLWVSDVGLGTWKFGLPDTGDGARVGPPEAFRILDRAVELGVTFWDTANRYNGASGNSERLIGRWLAKNPDQRRNVVIATKVVGGMDGRSPNHSHASRTNLIASVQACLQRLQVDYIDVLYLHRFDPRTPPEETLETISDLVSRDMVRYFAVSNYTVDQLEIFRAWEARYGARCRVLAVQNRFDVLRGETAAEQGVLSYCATHGISFVAHGPLATGLLTERYLDPRRAAPGDRLYDEGTLNELATPEAVTKVRALAELARSYGMRLSQMVLAYMLQMPGMGPVIPGVSSVEQLEMNAAAGKTSLSGEQVTAIQQVLQSSTGEG